MKTDKLLTLDYYVEKVSLAMQNDPIFMQQIADLVMYMNAFNNAIDSFKNALQLLLYDIIANQSSTIEDYTYTDLLDKIASIFNLSRDFVIDFKNPLTNEVDTLMKAGFDTFNLQVAHSLLSTTVHLNNNQLRLLIYCAIMKNSYDGSYEMLEKTYKTVRKFISCDIESATNWYIYQATEYIINDNVITGTPAAANCIFAYSNWEFEDNAENREKSQYFTLFFSGFLTIQSAGIYYYYVSADLAMVLYWAPEDDEPHPLNTDWYKWSAEPPDANDERRWL